MTIANWADIDIKLVEPMKEAGIATVEDLLGIIKIAKACKDIEEETGVSVEDIFKLCHRKKNGEENGWDSSPELLSKEYIEARDRILKKNKELYERLS